MKIRTLARGAVLALMLTATASVGANAGQPANPGCFGTARAEHSRTSGGQATAFYTSLRAGDNGEINRAYMESCGGTP